MRRTLLDPRAARVFFCPGTLLAAALAWPVDAAAAAAPQPGAVQSAEKTDAVAGPSGGLNFDAVFFSRGEPASVHYRARYTAAGKPHETEAWRDGTSRYARRTDGRVATYVRKPARDVEWKMVVLDLQRHIRTDIDRSNLLRIGHFTDWFSMTHAVQRPSGPYRLTTDNAPPGQAVVPVSACRWYRLQQGTADHRLCWSSKTRLPLLITDAQGKVQWQVTEVDTRPIAAAAFRIDDTGYVRNNANEDIQAD